jgi:hypothetical protein
VGGGEVNFLLVIPGPPKAEPGIQFLLLMVVVKIKSENWIPAFAGMTSKSQGAGVRLDQPFGC